MTNNGQKGAADELQAKLLDMLQVFRRVEGERLTNHLLRNLLAQSSKQLEDVGFAFQDETRDLKVQLLKAQSELVIANQYANHFGRVLKAMSLRRPGIGADKMARAAEEMIKEAAGAIKWEPGQPAAEPTLSDEIAQGGATH